MSLMVDPVLGSTIRDIATTIRLLLMYLKQLLFFLAHILKLNLGIFYCFDASASEGHGY